MSKETLQRHLDELHNELQSTDALDFGTRELLETVAQDIENALEDDEALDTQSLRERIEEAALRFEAEHPNLAQLLSNVTDVLAKLGV